MFDEYEDDGLMVITLLGENLSGATPSKSELTEWADAYGLNHPVVADSGFDVGWTYVDGNTIAFPSLSLLGPGAEVIVADGLIDESDVQNNLP